MASKRGREEKNHGRGTNLSALAWVAMRLGLPCTGQGKAPRGAVCAQQVVNDRGLARSMPWSPSHCCDGLECTDIGMKDQYRNRYECDIYFVCQHVLRYKGNKKGPCGPCWWCLDQSFEPTQIALPWMRVSALPSMMMSGYSLLSALSETARHWPPTSWNRFTSISPSQENA